MDKKEIVISVDVMGGDNAPTEIVQGIIEALKEISNLKIIAVGDKTVIENIIKESNFESNRLEILHTEEIIETSESPLKAVRTKRDSSLVRAIRLVGDGITTGCVSAGNSGALLVAAQAYIKRINGIKRTPLAPIIPTKKGAAILVDCGANVDARPEHLSDFAKLGSIYAESVGGIKNPKVALLNIGAEEEKGNKLVKETFPLIKELKNINFVGSIEARDILNGDVDVIVCDAFAGNIALKVTEGVFSMCMSTFKSALLSNIKTKIGAFLIKDSLRKALKPFDISKYGGAPLLGLEGLVVKCHGNAKRTEILNGIRQTYEFAIKDINTLIKKEIDKYGNK